MKRAVAKRFSFLQKTNKYDNSVDINCCRFFFSVSTVDASIVRSLVPTVNVNLLPWKRIALLSPTHVSFYFSFSKNSRSCVD